MKHRDATVCGVSRMPVQPSHTLRVVVGATPNTAAQPTYIYYQAHLILAVFSLSPLLSLPFSLLLSYPTRLLYSSPSLLTLSFSLFLFFPSHPIHLATSLLLFSSYPSRCFSSSPHSFASHHIHLSLHTRLVLAPPDTPLLLSIVSSTLSIPYMPSCALHLLLSPSLPFSSLPFLLSTPRLLTPFLLSTSLLLTLFPSLHPSPVNSFSFSRSIAPSTYYCVHVHLPCAQDQIPTANEPCGQ